MTVAAVRSATTVEPTPGSNILDATVDVLREIARCLNATAGSGTTTDQHETVALTTASRQQVAHADQHHQAT